MSARSAFRKWRASPPAAASATAATCASRVARYARRRRMAAGRRGATRATAGCAGCTSSSPPPAAAGEPGLERLPSRERVRERAAVDVLELSAERDAVGDAARAHAAPRGELTQVVRGRLALDRRVGGDDQLAHDALGEYRLEVPRAELLGADAIER